MEEFLSWGGAAVLAVVLVIWSSFLNNKHGLTSSHSALYWAVQSSGYTLLTAIVLLISGAVFGMIVLLLLNMADVDVSKILTRMASWPW